MAFTIGWLSWFEIIYMEDSVDDSASPHGETQMNIDDTNISGRGIESMNP